MDCFHSRGATAASAIMTCFGQTFSSIPKSFSGCSLTFQMIVLRLLTIHPCLNLGAIVEVKTPTTTGCPLKKNADNTFGRFQQSLQVAIQNDY